MARPIVVHADWDHYAPRLSDDYLRINFNGTEQTKKETLTYLRSGPAARAVMHASGAVVTKLVPFVLVPVARAGGQPRWVVWTLLAVGAGQIVTDAVFSTRSSDWKKVRRELRAAKK